MMLLYRKETPSMPTRRARLRRRIYNRLPRWLKRHDFEVLAAILCIAGGLPILFGQVQPASPEQLLPQVVVLAWAFTLVAGGVCILIGIMVGVQKLFPARVFWMRVEALGLTALAYASYIYMICILGVSAQTGWVAGMITLAFGGICHVRSAAINIELEAYRRDLGLEEKV